MGYKGVEGRALSVEARLRNNCGAPVSAGGVTFRSGDDVGALTPLGDGIYAGTWIPLAAAATSELTLSASAGLLGSDGAVLVGEIEPNAGDWSWAAPPVHGATFEVGRPLPPGVIATLFGRDLSVGTLEAASTPLPWELAGSTIMVAGRPAPLFFISPTQANFQHPYEAPTNTLSQALPAGSGAYAPPRRFLTAAAQPGVFSLIELVDGPSRAVVQNQDFSLNTSANPAPRGTFVTVFLSGQGAPDVLVASGALSPGQEPFGRAAFEASATVGGVEAEIVFLGLTPGFVGLTQANMFVPEGAPQGGQVAVVITIAGESSPPLFMSVN
jgi:uncharacterized protein (TIGR03437 family)